MNHKQKTRLARKLRTPEETRERTPIFMTKAWEARAAAKRRKQERQEAAAAERRKEKSINA